MNIASAKNNQPIGYKVYTSIEETYEENLYTS